MLSFRLRATILYLVLATTWIYLSDRGLVALVGDSSVLTDWQSLKGLAFVLINGGLVYWLAGRGAVKPAAVKLLTDKRMRWACVTVFLISLALGSGVIAEIESARVLQRRAIAFDRVTDHAHALEMQIDRAMSATYALAAMVRQGQGHIDTFDDLTTQMLPLYPGVSALALAPDGVVTEIVPRAGNEGSIGIDFLSDPKRYPTARKALNSRTVKLEGPLKLSNGSSGLIGRLAVFLGEGESAHFWGFVTAVARVDDLMRMGNLQQMAAAGYQYRLVSQETNAPASVLAESTSAVLNDPVDHSVQVSNSRWVLSVVPIIGWHAYPSLLVEFLLALLVSTLLAYLVYVLLRQPQLLRREVELRTSELATANRRLGNLHQAVEQSPVTVMITDRAGRIEYVNPRFTELTGYTAEQALGQTARMIKSGVSPDEVYAQMWQSLLAGRQWRGELCNRKQNGELFWESEVIAPVRDEQGEIAHFIAVKEDVTERRLAQAALERLNRTLHVLSEGNNALVRTGDEATLLAEVGRILVEVGGYGLVWVGMPVPGNETVLRPVMMAPGDRVEAALLTHDRGTESHWPGLWAQQ